MTTLQRIIWILFLTIGLISNNCCGDRVDFVLKTEYIYNNKTTQNIVIKLINSQDLVYKSYTINPNSSLNLLFESEGTGILPAFWIDNGNSKPTKIKVLFETDNKCITYQNNGGILNYKNYDNYNDSMNNNHKNTLLFDFDSSELSTATTCQ